METVDQAASGISEPTVDSPTEEPTETRAPETPSVSDRKTVTPAPADPWAGLIESGLSFLQQLADASRKNTTEKFADSSGDGGKPANAGLSFVKRDPKTGEPYFHLPMPKPDALERFLSVAKELLRPLKT
jgi:hypothetical protein